MEENEPQQITNGGKTSKPRRIRPQGWCFTWNNPVQYGGLLQTWFDSGLISTGCCQLEKGKEGTLHLQGAVQFTKARSLSSVKGLLPLAHWEPRVGSIEQAERYCSKEDTRVEGPWKVGKVLKKGQRTDLEGLKRTIDERRDPWDEHFGTMLRYHKGIEAYKIHRMMYRSEITKVEVRFGDPGTGKTEGTLLRYPDSYWKPSSKWWDGYVDQEVVVLDEFLGWYPFHDLLKLLDGTPLWLEKKGSQVSFLARKVVLISNREPHKWYDYEGKHLDWKALERRLDRDGAIWEHRKGEEPRQWKSYKDYMDRILPPISDVN